MRETGRPGDPVATLEFCEDGAGDGRRADPFTFVDVLQSNKIIFNYARMGKPGKCICKNSNIKKVEPTGRVMIVWVA